MLRGTTVSQDKTNQIPKGGKEHVSLISQLVENHYKRQRAVGQVKPLDTPVISAVIADNMEVFFAGLTVLERKLLNYIFWLDAHYFDIWASQDKMARYAGISRGHASRLLLKFEKLGVIASRNRGVRVTCLYKIANYFRDPKVRHKLSSLFAALSFMPFHQTVLRNGEWQKRDLKAHVTQYKDKSSFIKYLYIPALSRYIPEPVIHERAREEGTGTGRGGNNSKGRAVMSEKTPIRDSIVALKQLNLTIYGQIRLSMFSDAALEYASRRIEYSIAAKDKFSLFWAICRDYSKDNGLRLDWELQDKLKEEYGYPQGCLMVNSPASRNSTTAQLKSSPQGRRGGPRSTWKPITNEEFYAKNRAELIRVNDELIARGKESLPFPDLRDPFLLDDPERREYFTKIDRSFLLPLLKLGLSAPRIERERKLMIVKTMIDLGISFSGIITQQQLDQIMTIDILNANEAVDGHQLTPWRTRML